MYKTRPQKKYYARLCFGIAFFGQVKSLHHADHQYSCLNRAKNGKKLKRSQKKPLFYVLQSDTKCVGEVRNCVGEMKRSVGEMKQTVGETKQFVGEMKQI